MPAHIGESLPAYCSLPKRKDYALNIYKTEAANERNLEVSQMENSGGLKHLADPGQCPLTSWLLGFPLQPSAAMLFRGLYLLEQEMPDKADILPPLASPQAGNNKNLSKSIGNSG